MVQQPEIGAEAGMDKVTLGRVRRSSPSLAVALADLLLRYSYPLFQLRLCKSSFATLKESRCESAVPDSLSSRQRTQFRQFALYRDAELPYLFCSCSLREEDGSTAVELSQPAATADRNDGVEEEFSALIGNLVRNSHRVPDLDGNTGSFFVFEDMSVRTTGRYTLEFRLGEA